MLSLDLPLEPMLARTATTVPEGDFAYEPKWDGYRCIILRDGDRIELGSRGKKTLTRYFPELLPVVATLPGRCIVDSELVVRSSDGQRLSWDLLSQRIHPAESRIRKLSQETPAELICFDLLALEDEDWTPRRFAERRQGLEQLFDVRRHQSLHLSGLTLEPEVARRWFEQFEGAGLDGIIAKPLGGRYEQGKRSLVKVKHKRTADAVVVGYRIASSGQGVGSLLLGMYDDDGNLVRVGGIVGLPAKTRMALIDELAPLVLDGVEPSLESPRSRFSSERDANFVPLRPERVVEVAFDQLEGTRFRHAVTLLRWRDDRDPESCLLEQVERAPAYDLDSVLDV